MAYQREPLAVRFGMAIPRALNNGFGYLSAVPGYKGVVAPLLAFTALAVGIETTYKVMPQTSWSLPREERAFIPKIAVEDSPEIGRLIPFKQPTTDALRAIAPVQLDRFVPNPVQKTVWFDPVFWVAVVICSAVQHQESKLFKRRAYSDVRNEALKANQTQKLTANPNALAYAKSKVAKHNAYGMGAETKAGAMIILLYGLEGVGFMLGFKGATSKLASLLWGAYVIFGFEVFYDRGDRADSITPTAKNPQAIKGQ